MTVRKQLKLPRAQVVWLALVEFVVVSKSKLGAYTSQLVLVERRLRGAGKKDHAEISKLRS